MGQQHLEEEWSTLGNSERVTLEMLLVSYPLLFMNLRSFFPIAYLWIALSVGVGILTYMLGKKINYTVTMGVGLAVLLLVIVLISGLPLSISTMISGYSFWRIHENFSKSKVMGWPFLIANTLVFIVFYLLIKPFYVNDNPSELMKNFVLLYAFLTILYFIIRFCVTCLKRRPLDRFRILENGKIFGALLVIGFTTYTLVYFLFTPVRNGIIAVIGFLFGGIFMFILKVFTPSLDAMIAYLDSKREEFEKGLDNDVSLSDFDMQGKVEVFGNSAKDMGPLITLMALIGLVVLFVIVWKRKSSVFRSESSRFQFMSSKRNHKEIQSKSIYDYSETVGEIRNAFKTFEELAQTSKAPRLQGETMNEWFTRMGWSNDETLFRTYNQARYGSESISEKDRTKFIKTLEEIKSDLFIKNV